MYKELFFYLIRERLAATGRSISLYEGRTTGIPAGLLDKERDLVTLESKKITSI